MKSYRCYFSDRNLRVRAFRHIACADDAAAMTIASSLLKQNLYAAAELWHRDTFVGQLPYGADPNAVAEAPAPLSTGLETLQPGA
jgi:hypothetical protein